MLLAIDTCGSTGTIALARREGEQVVILGQAELEGKTFAAMLVPRLQQLLQKHHITLQQIEAIVIVNGPGSFTGVRVGVSAVKGLAEVFATPVVAVSRLHVLAHKAQARYAALDAGRGEFYFRDDNPQSRREALLSLAELREQAPTLVICEEKLLAAFPDAQLIAAPTAADALTAAMPRILSRDFDDLAALDGNYLRRSDAEVKAKAAKAS
jgi:tRNA threonylcarbamoyladenosine biosynthesis protein TsaB